MIIACPSCATRYQVDEAKFPPQGRTVRCAKCGNSWHQQAPRSEAAPEEIIVAQEDQPAAKREAESQPAAEPAPRSATIRSGPASDSVAKPARGLLSGRQGELLPLLAVVAGWAGLIGVVTAIAVSAVRYRQDIAAIWPQSAGVYSSLGLKVSPSAIDFRGINYRRENENGVAVLAVTGHIVNNGRRELPVPQTIRVTLSDAGNHEIYHWSFHPRRQSGVAVETLKPGESVPFVTRLSSPPDASRHLEVRFAKDGS